MAGLSREGFTPLSFNDLKTRISNRLNQFSSGIDLSAESPDGQLVDIFSFELAQVWNELGLVFNSYNPNEAVGSGLRNLGLLTGIPYGSATRSQAFVNLSGLAGTIVPAGAIVTDSEGNEFVTQLPASIPSSVQVVANLSGPISVDIGDIDTIKTSVTGWEGVSNTLAGRVGASAQSEVQYRNLRNKTVMRNYSSSEDVISARLVETLGIEQVSVVNNDSGETLPDGTPANSIHVTVGDAGSVSDLDIGQVILATKGLACPTFGNTSVQVVDSQQHTHIVKFSRATAVPVFINVEVKFLDVDSAGAESSIRKDLVSHINNLSAGDDVVWSRLFGVITPYAKAQVNVLEIGKSLSTLSPRNIEITPNEFAQILAGQINIKVVN